MLSDEVRRHGMETVHGTNWGNACNGETSQYTSDNFLFQIKSFTAVPQNPFSHLDHSATVCTESVDRAC